MANLIPNQPVAFPKLTGECNCDGQPYAQPVTYSDYTTFFVPNICRRLPVAEWGSVFIAHFEAFSGGQAGTVTLSAGSTYAILFNISSLCAGQQVEVILFTNYEDREYVTAETYTTTGAKEYVFENNTDYEGIGVIITGTCTDEGSSSLTVSSFRVAGWEKCVHICIKDLEGETLHEITDYHVINYTDFIRITIPWADDFYPLDPGCYKLCICQGDFGENLYPFSTSGTFEEAVAGDITDNYSTTGVSGTGIQRSSTVAYSGSYSLRGENAGVMFYQIRSREFYIKPNTRYKAFLYAYIDANEATTQDAQMYLYINSDYPIEIHSQDDLDPLQDTRQWHKLSIEFSTGTNIWQRARFVFTVSGTDTSILAQKYIYIDNLTLMEVTHEDCSYPFNLQHSHPDTLLIKYRNNEPAFGWPPPRDYYYVPLDAYFSLRIKAFLKNPRYPEENETHEYSDGSTAILYGSTRKIYELQIADAPEYIHDALRVAFLHDEFYIDGKRYVKLPGDYTPMWRRGRCVASALVEVEEAEQLTKNSNCQ